MQTSLLSGLCLLLLALSAHAVRYESEDHHNVGAVTTVQGFGSGLAYVHHEEIGAATTFTVFVEDDNVYNATIGHLSSQGSLYHVSVNGLNTQKISLVEGEHGISLNLRKGSNLITIEKKSYHTSKLDFLDVPMAYAPDNRGAPVAYQTYEAESASHSGKVIGPNRDFGTLPSEASGRQAVQIYMNQWVEFTTAKQAEGIVVRFSIPDSSDGNGLNGPLEVTGPNMRFNLTLTSKFSWVYGQFPFSNRPSDRSPHHFYDEVRQMFPSSVPAGTKIRLTCKANLLVTVDMVEFHQIPAPYTQNNEVVSVLDYGADATGNRDSSDAIQKAMNSFAAKGKKGIFMPKGRYLISRHFHCRNIVVGGAGPWHTIVYTKSKANFGFLGGGAGAQLFDFALIGATAGRIDTDWDNALGGDMSRGTAHNIWVEHVKVGLWMEGSNVDGFMGNGLTIRNTWADGVNFHKAISNSVIQNSDIRNTGDDCLAIWSGEGLGKKNKFNRNTIKLPMLANTIAIYGGQDNQAVGNLLSDTVSSGSCIHIGNRFKAMPLSGTTLAQDNTMIRCGSPNYNRPGHSGAVWIFPEDSPINSAVQIVNSDISDSYSAAFSVFTGTINNLQFTNANVKGGLYVLELSNIAGSATLSGIKAEGLKSVGVASCVNKFSVKKGSGNSGWDTTKCLNF